jgi:proliferating cell nuclear antigen
MDNSHIALVSLSLTKETFSSYRCDRNMSLGMNLTSLTKILKCAGANDQVKIMASDDSDVLGLDFQNRRRLALVA